MSRQNKVNPNHYTIAGRLSPDDLARELRRNRPRPDWHDRREDLPFEPEPARGAGTQDAATATDVTAPARRATPRKPTVRRAATATVRRPRKAPARARRKTAARAPKRTVAKPKAAKRKVAKKAKR